MNAISSEEIILALIGTAATSPYTAHAAEWGPRFWQLQAHFRRRHEIERSYLTTECQRWFVADPVTAVSHFRIMLSFASEGAFASWVISMATAYLPAGLVNGLLD